MRILLIDDEQNFLDSLVVALQQNECTTEIDPISALELCKKNNYDVIIADISLMHYAGLDFVKKFKEYNKHVQLIWLTDQPDYTGSKHHLILRKPVNYQQLMEILNSSGKKCEKRKHKQLVNRIVDKCKKLDAQWLVELPSAIYCFVYPIVQGLIYRADIRHEYETIFKQNGSRVLHLVDCLLDLSGCATGDIEFYFENFNLEFLMDDIIKSFAKHLMRKDIEMFFHFNFDSPVLFYSDKARIRQMINYLLQNAVNNTEKGEIHIYLTTDEDVESKNILLSFTIKDTGTNLYTGNSNRIFSIPNSTHFLKPGFMQSAGLNLPLVKALVERMGGTIDVCAEEGKGNEFTMTLPLHESIPEHAQAPVVQRTYEYSL